MQACPKRTRAGWTTIYEQIQTRMENLHKTKQELGINFNRPLREQDPLDKLNDLARKKRKHADDIYDYFKSTNRYKSLDFVTIEDFKDFTNEMIYTVQEIFFRLHQGHGQDDHARTFSSFLLAEGEIVGLVPEPFSLSIDLNIKSPKCKLAEDKFSFISLKTIQLQFFSSFISEGANLYGARATPGYNVQPRFTSISLDCYRKEDEPVSHRPGELLFQQQMLFPELLHFHSDYHGSDSSTLDIFSCNVLAYHIQNISVGVSGLLQEQSR
ncbi:hypothetical protein Tco_0411330 [Tanacetum coccineum]